MSRFLHRLKFYAIGFLLGLVMVNYFFKDRAICRMPGTLKLEELQKQKPEFTSVAHCTMKCLGVKEQDIRELLKNGSVNYDASDVHATPCPRYAVEGKLNGNRKIRVQVNDCDSISRIQSVSDLASPKEACECK